MRSRTRSTICPLCGTQLGATVEDQWVPMALDEYREHARLRLIPRSLRTAAPESCIACASLNQELEPLAHANRDVRSGARVVAEMPQGKNSRWD
jgi:hypothetical protein